jgi:hypothetical protein
MLDAMLDACRYFCVVFFYYYYFIYIYIFYFKKKMFVYLSFSL